MISYVGSYENCLLFTDNQRAVIVDILSNTVAPIDESETLIASAQWDASVAEPERLLAELARAANLRTNNWESWKTGRRNVWS
jgi:hypothetical protein